MNTYVRRYATFLIVLWVGCWGAVPLSAQLSPIRISYTAMDLYALRYYPFQIQADTIVQKMFVHYDKAGDGEDRYQRTSLQLVTNKEYLDMQIRSLAASNRFVYKHLVRPYLPWLQYAVPLNADSREIALPVGLEEDQQSEAVYAFLGKKNVHFLIDELLSESGLFHPGVTYRYFLSGRKMIDEQDLYEIAFYPKHVRNNAFTGYLYISTDDNCNLVKAVYTRSNLFTSKNVGKVLWTQTFETSDEKTFPLKKEAAFTMGDILRGSLVVNRTTYYSDSIDPLTAAEQQTSPFVHTAGQTRAFRNLQTLIRLAMTDRLTLGGPQGAFEWGPVTQSLSYNFMEGLRLRAGGNTTMQLNPHFLFGGYLAYGTIDQRFKYRGDLLYSLLPKERDIWEFPKRLFSLTYAYDLNIPGQDLLDNQRDAFFHSFSHSAYNMSLQKTVKIDYEHEWANRLSLHIGGRYLYDRPRGEIQHAAITTSEIYFTLRYAPGELFMQNRDNRTYLRRTNLESIFRHRIGLKNVFGSDYHYHITDFSVYKRWYLPNHVGYGDTRLSVGKVWTPTPFPLLFIPKGNQSYIFSRDKYNAMRVYEFVTDRFVAGQIDLQFNWSPFNLLFRSGIKTTGGIKALYGPLSDQNQPALHPELFPFPPEIHLLNQTPYVEMHIGLANILRVLRIEWVQRMTYSERGTLLFRASF